MKEDTLYLFQEFGEYDSTFQEGSIHRAGKILMKYLFLEHDKLKLIYYENSNAVTGFTTFGENYILKLVNK